MRKHWKTLNVIDMSRRIALCRRVFTLRCVSFQLSRYRKLFRKTSAPENSLPSVLVLQLPRTSFGDAETDCAPKLGRHSTHVCPRALFGTLNVLTHGFLFCVRARRVPGDKLPVNICCSILALETVIDPQQNKVSVSDTVVPLCKKSDRWR